MNTFKVLCTVSSNGVTTKDPRYMSRILAIKTESFGATTYLLSLFKVTLLDEGKYGLTVVHGNRKILENQVFLEVHGKCRTCAVFLYIKCPKRNISAITQKQNATRYLYLIRRFVV